jgi:outer membrane protein TolC
MRQLKMKTSIAVARYVSRSFVVCTAAILVFANCARAQFGGTPSASQSTQVNPLPLSGRTSQNGSVVPVQTPVPGTTTSVDTVNPTVQVQGPYVGSASSTARMPFSGKLGFREAINRGLAFNLGAIGLTQSVRQAQGMSHSVRSDLLPNLNGSVTESVRTENLKALGLRFNFSIPGFTFPTIVGPYNYIDARVQLTQSVVDLTAINNYRSSREQLRSSQLEALNARDLVVLAVGGTYLQVLAAQARVASARAQVDSANAVYQQAAQQSGVGLVARVDVDRSQVQALTQQQRLVSLQNDLAKQKINLARLTGLPPTDQYELSDDIPFASAPPVTFDEALKQALDQRPDLRSALAQVRAGEMTRSAARAERLPSFSIDANYGAIGTTPSQAKATYTVAGTVRVPLWQGGRARGDIEQTDAELAQRKAEAEDLKSEIESEVRNAYLDLQTATSQVDLSQRNLQVSRETLTLTRQRFEAGVTDSVEVVQAEQTVASAELDYINSVFAHNVAKLSLARAIGGAADSLPQFLPLR